MEEREDCGGQATSSELDEMIEKVEDIVVDALYRWGAPVHAGYPAKIAEQVAERLLKAQTDTCRIAVVKREKEAPIFPMKRPKSSVLRANEPEEDE